MMKSAVILFVMAVMCGALAAAAPAVDTNQAFLWNGVHWQQVTTDGKAGYIFGIGNLADYEAAASKNRKMACVSPVIVNEMKTKTVMQIIQEVDKYYQDNPGKLGTPVLEVVLGQLTKAAPAEAPPGTTKK
jgi:opacity protein-like surface antigen